MECSKFGTEGECNDSDKCEWKNDDSGGGSGGGAGTGGQENCPMHMTGCYCVGTTKVPANECTARGHHYIDGKGCNRPNVCEVGNGSGTSGDDDKKGKVKGNKPSNPNNGSQGGASGEGLGGGLTDGLNPGQGGGGAGNDDNRYCCPDIMKQSTKIPEGFERKGLCRTIIGTVPWECSKCPKCVGTCTLTYDKNKNKSEFCLETDGSSGPGGGGGVAAQSLPSDFSTAVLNEIRSLPCDTDKDCQKRQKCMLTYYGRCSEDSKELCIGDKDCAKGQTCIGDERVCMGRTVAKLYSENADNCAKAKANCPGAR